MYPAKSYYEITIIRLLTFFITAHYVKIQWIFLAFLLQWLAIVKSLKKLQKLLCTAMLNKSLCMNNFIGASTFHFMNK